MPTTNIETTPERLIFSENWLDIEIPKVFRFEAESLTENYGKLIIEPLYKGFGRTLGNSLRRILLSSIMGHAIYAVRIEGVSHEFEIIPGIKEEVLQILLNLKELKFASLVKDDITLELIQSGPCIVTGNDISTLNQVEIKNKDQFICELDKDANIQVTLYLKMNRGYVTAKENFTEDLPAGTIFLDSAHSPVERVSYDVENTRVGQHTDYDRLILELWTNGNLIPEEAVTYAAKILQQYCSSLIYLDASSLESVEVKAPEEPVEVANPHLSKNINDLELSVRSINCLQNAKIDTIEQLVQKTEYDMLQTKNFGRKSLQEIKAVLADMGLSLGASKLKPENNETP